MKIDFHYFTIKFLAARSGYNEAEAQLIATACQFLNDNSADNALNATMNNLSAEIKRLRLYVPDLSSGSGMYKVPLLLSAISDDPNFAKLEDQTIQEERLIPFSYFAANAKGSGTNYKVTPLKTLSASTVFGDLFTRSARLYSPPSDPQPLAPASIQALRRLGILLHTVSDSMAYHLFNGYTSTQNDWRIEDAKDVRTFDDLTPRYKTAEITKYPTVGKFKTSSLTEDYNVQFVVSNWSLGTVNPVYITRINNDQFLKIARVVYNFLNEFRGVEPSDRNWQDNIKPILLKAWNTDAKTYADLKTYWSSQTPLQYDYDPIVATQSIVRWDPALSPEQQGYFDFVVMLKYMRDAVTGTLQLQDDADVSMTRMAAVEEGVYMAEADQSMPELLAYSMPAIEPLVDSFTGTISEPQFNGEQYEMILQASLPAKIRSLTVSISIQDTERAEQVYSNTYKLQNIKTITDKIVLLIPHKTQHLQARVVLKWMEDGQSQQQFITHNYTIKGNDEVVLNQHLQQPCHRDGRPAVQVVNGSQSVAADYCYPKNAMYISQQKERLLDLYLPIDYQLQLAAGFSMADYTQPDIVLRTADGDVIKYCNNSKFVTVEFNEETGLIEIQAEEEWKNRILVNTYPASIAKMKLSMSLQLKVISDDEEGYRLVVINTDHNNELITDIEYLWNL
ncbi:DUF6765 family protein [Paenibacillus campi]|uniref:DUF6765 family protein n=1 Tax=Paenibacillus campi TaxID=3106031 RepID=UPI002AFE5638|nr:DUF6765 family protein [Paenibacillus sp. SGZ-1014]